MTDFREGGSGPLTFVDKHLLDGVELAYQFEKSLHQAVSLYSDKSDEDRRTYLAVLKHIDQKLNIKSERLDKAYFYLNICTLEEFWVRLNLLKQIREDLWDNKLNGT